MNPGANSISSVQAWLFTPVYATALAVLRIVTGLLMVLWSVSLLGVTDPLLTWMRTSPNGDVGWWQALPLVGPTTTTVLTLGLVAASLLMTVGLLTRAATLTAFLLTLVLQRFNPAAFNGGDLVLRGVLLLPLALAPAGAYLSLDARFRAGGFQITAPKIPPWPLRFIQLHVSLGYILTVYLKLLGSTWPSGTAMWYALGLDDLTRFDLPVWLLVPPVGAILSWGTLLVELGVGVGVWFPKARRWVLAAGVLLHLGIAVLFEIGFFSIVMITTYLAWLPDVADVRLLLRRQRGRSRRISRTILKVDSP